MIRVYTEEQEPQLPEPSLAELAKVYALRRGEDGKYYVLSRTSGRIVGDADTFQEARELEVHCYQEHQYGLLNRLRYNFEVRRRASDLGGWTAALGARKGKREWSADEPAAKKTSGGYWGRGKNTNVQLIGPYDPNLRYPTLLRGRALD